MKTKKFSIVYVIIGLAFLYLAGCEETARTPEEDWTNNPLWSYKTTNNTTNTPASVAAVTKSPKLTFEKKVHDFGNVSPQSSQICTFNFKNTGTDILRITDVNTSCGCTIYELPKREYAPGESGILPVGYLVESQLGEPTKLIHVVSNDPVNPKIELSIKAKITAAVDLQPRALKLSLIKPNADCPEITVTSLDNQPFSITAFASTDNCITADYDSSPATSHIIKLKADMGILEANPDGLFEIGTSHPASKVIGGTYSAPARFTATPKSITIYQAGPETITRKVTLVSNYDENFDIESFPSRDKIISVTKKTKVSKGYELELAINPPTDSTSRSFTDVLSLKLTGGRTVEIYCNGTLAANTQPAQRTQAKVSDKSRVVPAKTTTPPTPKTQTPEKEKDCPTCKGPLLVNPSSWPAK